jgi:hypothetical protein
MGVGRAQDAADQHARHRQVRAVLREPRHLRHAVRTNRPGPDPFELLYRSTRSDVVHSYLARLPRCVWLCERVARAIRKCKRARNQTGNAFSGDRFGLDHRTMLD